MEIKIKGRSAVLTQRELLTSGSVGISVGFRFDSEWHVSGLSRTAVFAGSGADVDVLLGSSNRCAVPQEVLVRHGGHLRIGVYGTDSLGNVVIPTVWVDAGRIERGT